MSVNIANLITSALIAGHDGKLKVQTEKTNMDGAVRSALVAVATAFVGFTGNSDDSMRQPIREGWFAYVQQRSIVKKDGSAYASANDMPAPTLSNYITFAKAGQSGTFPQASAAVDGYLAIPGNTGTWHTLCRDLLSKHGKGEAALTVDGVKAMVEKTRTRDKAIDSLIKMVKRLAKDHSFSADNVVASLNAIKGLPEAPKAAAPVLHVVPKVEPVPAPVAAPAAAPMNLSTDPNAALIDMVRTLAQGQAALQTQVAAFMAKPSKKAAK